MDYNTTLQERLEEKATVFEVDDHGSAIPFNCSSHFIPSISEYFTAFNEAGVALFSLGGMAVMIVLCTYVDTIRHIIKNAPPGTKTHSAFVVSVYPVVAMATYCATIVPRAQLLAEAVSQGMFMCCLYQLFCLVVAYSGGEAELIRKVQPNSLVLNVAPCCCWPCCSLLPVFSPDKLKVRRLRLLVLQLPVVQGIIYMILLVMWAEEQSLYQVNHNYFLPVIVTSIITGIWGMVMTLKMTEEVLKEYHLKGKFFVLQFVLIFAKFQAIAAKMVVWSNAIECRQPITPTVFSNLIYNSVILWEMVMLSVIARHLYRRPVPETYPTNKHNNLPSKISTLSSIKADLIENNNITDIIKA